MDARELRAQNDEAFKRKYMLLTKNLDALIFFNPNEMDLYAACHELAGKLLRLHVKQNKRYRPDFLQDILKSLNYIVTHRQPEQQAAQLYDVHLATLYTASVVTRKHPVLKALSILLLAVVGAAILAATGLLAAAAFGFCPPLALAFGVVIGYSIASGAAISAVGGLLGMSALMGSGMMLFKTVSKPSVSSRLSEVHAIAKEKDSGAGMPEYRSFEMV